MLDPRARASLDGGGSLGFKFEYHGVKIVYATDNEIDQLIVGGAEGRASTPRLQRRVTSATVARALNHCASKPHGRQDDHP